MISKMSQKKLYFTAGPAKIPAEVMQQVQNEFTNYKNLDIGVVEMSHRSKEFEFIINEAEMNLRKLLNIPENYAVLFMHGGAKSQFDSVPMNLCSELDKCKADYLVNGSWSGMACKEAAKYLTTIKQEFKAGENYSIAPEKSELVSFETSC